LCAQHLKTQERILHTTGVGIEWEFPSNFKESIEIYKLDLFYVNFFKHLYEYLL